MAYSKIFEAFWSDRIVRQLDDDGRHFFLYLLTCSHRNRLGMFLLDTYYACADLQWGPERVVAARDQLADAGRICWDEESRVVYIPRYLDYNVLENPNVVKAAISELDAVPDNLFLNRFANHLETIDREHYDPLRERVRERLQKWSEKPLDGESTERDTESRKPNVDNDVETVPDTPGNGSGNGSTNNMAIPNLTYPNHTEPLSLSAREREADPDELERMLDEQLESIGHRGGRKATEATLRQRYLYPDGEASMMASGVVKDLPLEKRRVLVLKALQDQVTAGNTHFEQRAMDPFIRKLRRDDEEVEGGEADDIESYWGRG